MDISAWVFITQHAAFEDIRPGSQTYTDKIVEEYLQLIQNIGKQFNKNDFLDAVPARKRIAPLFAKPFDIPIVDDSRYATENNPGMLGIRVKPFDPKGVLGKRTSGYSLSEALQIVRNHYSRI